MGLAVEDSTSLAGNKQRPHAAAPDDASRTDDRTAGGHGFIEGIARGVRGFQVHQSECLGEHTRHLVMRYKPVRRAVAVTADTEGTDRADQTPIAPALKVMDQADRRLVFDLAA